MNVIVKPASKIKSLLGLSALALILPLSACMHFSTQQGNVLKAEKLSDIHKGDTRFHVESLIGSPVLKDDLHPNRVIYVDDLKDVDTDEIHQRRIEIVYDTSGRVKSIKRVGFNDSEKADTGE